MKKFITKRNIYYLIEFISLILAGYTLFRGFWTLLNDYGSGKFGTNFGVFYLNIPYYLFTILSIYFVIFIHLLIHPSSLNGYKKTILYNGIIMSIISLIILIYTFILLGLGKYYLVMGNTTLLYPLDMIIITFIILSTCIYMIIKKEKLAKTNVTKLFIKDDNKTKRIIFNILKSIGFIFILYFVGLNSLFFFTFDYSFSHFFQMSLVYILTFIPITNIVIYEIYNEMSNSENKRQLWFVTSITTFFLTTFLLLFIAISEITTPDFLVDSGTALFPVDHMLIDSPPFGIIISALLMYNLSLIPFINYLIRYKKDACENIITFNRIDSQIQDNN